MLVNAKKYLHLDINQSGEGDEKSYVNLPDVEKLGGFHQRLVIFILIFLKIHIFCDDSSDCEFSLRTVMKRQVVPLNPFSGGGSMSTNLPWHLLLH